MDKPLIPILKIGENNWIEKLTEFLESYDIEATALNIIQSEFELPKPVINYYQNFGGIESIDFMYNLYKPKDFISISNSDWSFVKENFAENELNNLVVFSESPANDPLCLHLENKSIYLFSHDPVTKSKVFENFDQYLRYEILEIQKLMGDIQFSGEQEIAYHKEYLNGVNIDYNFRCMKLC